jgi:hypothetical protein
MPSKSKETDQTGFKYLLVSLFLAVLAFFILLNSISIINQEKTEDILEKVREEFSGDNFISKFTILPKRTQGKDGLKEEASSLKDIIKFYVSKNSNILSSEMVDYGKKMELKISQNNTFYADCCDKESYDRDLSYSQIQSELSEFKKFLTLNFYTSEDNILDDSVIKKSTSDFIKGIVTILEDNINNEPFELQLLVEYKRADKVSFLTSLYKVDLVSSIFKKSQKLKNMKFDKILIPGENLDKENFIKLIFMFEKQ